MKYYLLASDDNQIRTFWGIFYDPEAAKKWATEYKALLFPTVLEFDLHSSQVNADEFYFCTTTGHGYNNYIFGLWADEEEMFGWRNEIRDLFQSDRPYYKHSYTNQAIEMLNRASPSTTNEYRSFGYYTVEYLGKAFNDPHGIKYFVRKLIPLPETWGLDELKNKNKLNESKIRIKIG